MSEERAKQLAELVSKTKSAPNPDDMQNTGGDIMRKFAAVVKNQKPDQAGSWTTYGNFKITHIVNTAEGDKSANVNLDVDQLEANGVSYIGCQCHDSDDADISQYFKATGDFIEAALAAGGKVVVNCWGGKSRSSTITLAFLIQKTNLTLEDAIVQVKSARTINPNLGFLTALIQLEESLASK